MALAAVVCDLQKRPDCCVINAAPGRWHPGPGKPVLRRLYAAVELADDRDGSTSRPGAAWTVCSRGRSRPVDCGRSPFCRRSRKPPTALVLLDFERVMLPAGIAWRDDLAYTAAYLRQNNLPDGFHGRRCTYFATSSAADLTKPDLGGDVIRMRLGFMLDRPLITAEAKRWLADVEGLDRCTLQPNQTDLHRGAGVPGWTAGPYARTARHARRRARAGRRAADRDAQADPAGAVHVAGASALGRRSRAAGVARHGCCPGAAGRARRGSGSVRSSLLTGDLCLCPRRRPRSCRHRSAG